MKKEVKTIDKIISNVALTSAKQHVNSVCNWFFYQPSIPDSVKKLKKYHD